MKQLHSDPDLADHVRRQTRRTAQIRHGNVAHVHRLTTHRGHLAVLLEPVHGASLAEVDGPLPPRTALGLAAAAAEALSAAWEGPSTQGEPLRVTHGGIRAANIMVTPSGTVKLLDFGFQARSRGHASDIGDLATLTVQLLTGHLCDDPRAALERLDRLDRQLRTALEPCLAADPDERPDAATCARSWHSLVPQLDGPSVEQWSSTWPPAVRAADTVDAVLSAPRDPLDSPKAANPWLLLAGPLCALALLAMSALVP